MEIDLKPLHFVPLREQFLERFEAMILSGDLHPGDRLPPERELAVRMGVSRPVVHDGLLELQARGLVRIHPRLGTVVEDFRQSGSFAMLDALFRFHQGRMDPGWLRDALDFRQMMEQEVVRRAARQRTPEDLRTLRRILDEEEATDRSPARAQAWTDLDFRFHHALAIASHNRLFPMAVQSFRPAWRHFALAYFRQPGTAERVYPAHRAIVDAIARRRPRVATRVLREMLSHGARLLAQVLTSDSGGCDG